MNEIKRYRGETTPLLRIHQVILEDKYKFIASQCHRVVARVESSDLRKYIIDQSLAVSVDGRASPTLSIAPTLDRYTRGTCVGRRSDGSNNEDRYQRMVQRQKGQKLNDTDSTCDWEQCL